MGENMLLAEEKDGVCTLTLNRPERRNALSPQLLNELAGTLTMLKAEDRIRCVVIRGSGDKAFCSGFDIADLPVGTGPEAAEAVKGDTPLDNGMKAVGDFPYPVIAMINGLAYGAGCELAITCDIRVAAESARFSIPPARLGIVYRWQGIAKCVDVVGLANAKEMLFTGRSYEALRAREMGLVHYVLPADALNSFVYEMAQEIAGNAPLSLKGMKFILNRLHGDARIAMEDIHEMEQLRYQAYRSEDVQEGQQAFREKRKPVFKGR